MSGSLESFQIADAGFTIPASGTFGPIVLPNPGGSYINAPITNIPPSLDGPIQYQTITPGGTVSPTYIDPSAPLGTSGNPFPDPAGMYNGGPTPPDPAIMTPGTALQPGQTTGTPVITQIGNALPSLTQLEELAIRALLVLVGIVLVAGGFYLSGARGVKAVTIRQLVKAPL